MRQPIHFVMVCLAAVLLGLAQKASADERSGTQGTKLHLLTAGEGRAIVRETSWVENADVRSTDCSHLVHELYEQAGYPYPYASSQDLYKGTENFVQVRAPQPGDLIVWRGHVGIVVDPKEHSFFSSVSEGTRTEYYDSAYWRARGYARFYRYLTSRPAKRPGRTTETASQPDKQEPKAQADSRGADHRLTLEPVKTVPAPASKGRDDAAPGSETRAINSLPIPLPISGRQPRAADVASALVEANREAGEMLRAGNLEQLERPVMVYRDLQVSGVDIKGKRGKAQVRIEALATFSGERMETQQGWKEYLIELQRTKNGWVMKPTNENVYVPRDTALRILAARLALLTQDAEASTGRDREQAEIIRFLNLLVE